MTCVVDPRIILLLGKCGCDCVQNYFKGVTLKDLADLPGRMLRRRLQTMIPIDVSLSSQRHRDEIIAKISKALNDLEEEDIEEETPTPIIVKEEIKIEDHVDLQLNGDGANQEGDSDSDIEILEEIPGDVEFLERRDRSMEIHELFLDNDGDGDEVEGNGNDKENDDMDISVDEESPQLPPGVLVDENDSEKRQYEHVKIMTDSQIFGKRRRTRRKGIENILCTWVDWVRERTNCTYENIVEISIDGDCKQDFAIAERGSGPKPQLPRLKKLTVFSWRVFTEEPEHLYCENYLVDIIKASAVHEINFSYVIDEVFRAFLKILSSVSGSESDENPLRNLKFLEIKPNLADPVALQGSEIEELAKMNAPSLEKLHLEFGLWEDTKPGLEKMLKGFWQLKELTIDGLFSTDKQKEPVIQVDFPLMPKLEYLSMGRSYELLTTYETKTERPAKKRMRNTNIRREREAEASSLVEPENQGSKYVHDDLSGCSFTVTLNLPMLPNLRHLQLGCLYDLKEHHFSRMKSLEVFRVASRWQDSVKWPGLKSKTQLYPKLVEIQFPDSLQDSFHIAQVVNLFPNLTKFYMNLPSVQVVRAFAHYMKMANRDIALLDLKVQFDFLSSLNFCFLDNPWISRQSEKEKDRIRILKEYKLWKDYVETNQIEIPDFNLPVPEKRFNGLEVIAERIKKLEIMYLPRTLRLPMGEFHFNDDRCQFTNMLIGFREHKYIFSPEAFEKRPLKNTTAIGFDTSQTKWKYVTDKRARHTLQLDPAMLQPVKKDERPE